MAAVAQYQRTLDECDLGNLSGALLVRTTLDSQFIQPICYRADESLRLAIPLVILGGLAKTVLPESRSDTA